ncbi:HD-GYP domain-containing protein [Variovorax sp. HJSM1_2]|uniref:HD-GYP domain-containing protein n=1 Tax=Variovorax sp. HJSM1_2 TaxID=3366263 RepID=UPI003BE6AD46
MLKRIRTQQLAVGMYISEFCGSWMEHPFWRTHFLLKDAKDLRRILDSNVQEVWIDASKGLDIASDADAMSESDSAAEVERVIEIAKTAAPTTTRVSISEELERATLICSRAREAVTAMFQEARLGHAVDTAVAQKVVQEITDSVARNAEALISLARIKTADDYTYMHSVAVCALMVALGRRLGLDEKTISAIGEAGLLHDVGKAMIPLSVLNKPGRLTEKEFDVVRGHPAAGYEILRISPGVSAEALDVCLHHHEKTDGSGYPKRLDAKTISLAAKMGAVCDVYDAITSNRPYKRGWDPAESIHKMAGWAEGHFDIQVFQAFVKSLGIYPVGSLVKLSSERIGVVTEQGTGSLLMPRVKVFFDTRLHRHIQPEMVDLSAGGNNEKIESREDPEQWHFPGLNALWSGQPHLA